MPVRFHSEAFREVGFDPEFWNEHVVIESSDPAAVAAALVVCVERMARVGLGGREYTDAELELLDGQVQTPTFANSDEVEGLPSLYVDCRAVVGGHRSATFRRVVREELARVGVIDALVRPVDSLPGSLKPLIEHESAPDWVRFADRDPAGFPPTLMPTGFAIVHRAADVLFATYPGGRSYVDDWLAEIYVVSDLEPYELVQTLSRQLQAAGCVARSISPEIETAVERVLYSDLIWETLDVDVAGIRLKGERRKPGFLRRRPETSGARISVIHINPDPSVPRRPATPE